MQKGPHWSQKSLEVVILAHADGSLGLTIKGGADFGEFPYLGEVKQEKIRYQAGELHQDDIILEVQGQKVAGFTQRDVVLWLKHSSKHGTPVVLKCVKKGFLTKDLRLYLSGGFVKGSLDHELQETIRDNLYMRTVPCTTRQRRDGENNGQDYWFLSIEEFKDLDENGHLLESGFYSGHHYGTPKPPHEPFGKKAEPVSEIIRPGGFPSAEGKRRRNRSNVEALSPGASTESTEDLLSALALNQHSQEPQLDEEYTPESQELNHHNDDRDPHRGFVTTQMKEDGGLWKNIASEAVAKVRYHDSGHHSEDDQGLNNRHEAQLPPGWEIVDDPAYGTYYIDHINKRTQYEHPGKSRMEEPPRSSTYNSSTFPRLKKRPAGSPDTRVPKSASSNLPLNGQQKPRILTQDALRGEFLDIVLIKGHNGLGFTIIGGEPKYPSADFDDDDVVGAGTLLQLKSIAPGGPAQMDGRLRPGDALVNINNYNVLGFTHDQVIQLFQSIHPGDQVRMRVCRGYPIPADATDPNSQVITTDTVSSATNSRINGSLSRATQRDIQRQLAAETRTSTVDSNDQEVAAAFGDQQQVATGPLYRLQIAKGVSGFGFTIAQSNDGQTIKRIVDKKRCQGLLEGDLLVEINGRNVRGQDHTAVVEVLKDAPLDHPSVFIVQRAQRIEGRKEQRTSRFMGRSKTPTADMYKTSNGGTEVQPKKQRSKTPTPRSTSSLFGFFRSKTPKPGKETVQESTTTTRVSSPPMQRERERSVERESVKTHRARTPEKAVSPAPQQSQEAADFKRNQFAYSSMTRMVTPSYIPASQYGKKVEEKARSPPVDEIQEWNEPMYAAAARPNQRPPPPVDVGLGSTRVNGDNRPARLRVNGPSFENSSLVSIPSSSILEGDNESQLHSPPGSIDLTVTLRREETGFGFRIIGGTEEGSQVSVGFVVPGGAAENDGRILVGDEILSIDGQSVLAAEHKNVIQMMYKSSQNGYVTLGLRRRINYASFSKSPRQVTIHRQPNEGFGFVIISSIARNQQLGGSDIPVNGVMAKNYPVLGRILEDSPAEHCGSLNVGDKILAVNGVDVLHLHHSEIVQMIKESGTSVTLAVISESHGPPDDASTISANSQHRYDEYTQQEPDGGYAHQHISSGTSKMEYHAIQLDRGTRGFGFSIRGGKEFQSMPLFVLRIAENGPAAMDGRLRVGDEIVEVNGVNTKDFTHGEAIDLIKQGGSIVRLLIKRNAVSGMVSPAHGFSPASLPQSPSTLSSSQYGMSRQYLDGGGPYEPSLSYSNYATQGSSSHAGVTSYGSVSSQRFAPTTHLQSTAAAFQARPYNYGSVPK